MFHLKCTTCGTKISTPNYTEVPQMIFGDHTCLLVEDYNANSLQQTNGDTIANELIAVTYKLQAMIDQQAHQHQEKMTRDIQKQNVQDQYVNNQILNFELRIKTLEEQLFYLKHKDDGE